jgi:hypothetical protein
MPLSHSRPSAAPGPLPLHAQRAASTSFSLLIAQLRPLGRRLTDSSRAFRLPARHSILDSRRPHPASGTTAAAAPALPEPSAPLVWRGHDRRLIHQRPPLSRCLSNPAYETSRATERLRAERRQRVTTQRPWSTLIAQKCRAFATAPRRWGPSGRRTWHSDDWPKTHTWAAKPKAYFSPAASMPGCPTRPTRDGELVSQVEPRDGSPE